MTRPMDRNLDGTANLKRSNALTTRQAQPARTSYTWAEVFGSPGDEGPTSDQVCEINSTQSQAPEVAADEFESVYLWFLA